MASSGIWQHFQQPDDKTGNYKVVCKHCDATISCTNTTTSNLHKHIKRKHATVSVDSRTNSDTTTTTQATLDGVFTTPKKHHVHHRRQQKVNEALVLCVCCDLLPFSVVDSPYFRGLLEAANPCYQMPTREHLVNKLLQEKYSEVKINIKSRLEIAECVSVTLDIWWSRQKRSYLGMTGHFLDDWRLNYVVLSCKRFHGRHTAYNIVEEFEEIRRRFNIDSKVTNIVTDNASNMISAFSLPGFKEVIISSVTATADGESEDLDETETEPELYDALPTDHSSCFAHTLQLVVNDGFKGSEHLSETVKKVSKLVSYVHRSVAAKHILEGEKKLERNCVTRWNSELKMIRSVLRVPEEKLNMTGSTSVLSAYDRNILTDMLLILEPFEEATDFIQRQNRVSASFVIPCVRGLRFHLRQVQSNYNNALVSVLLKSVDKRLNHYEKNKVYQLAATLDPRFKLDWCNTEEERVAIRSKLATQACALASTATPPPPAAAESAPPVKKRKKLFSFMDSSVCHPLPSESHDGRQISAVINTEIQSYLNQPCLSDDSDALAYWKGHKDMYPHTANVAKRYLSVPASFASVGRAFSIAGKVFRPDRCRVSDSHFETLMLIKCNENIC